MTKKISQENLFLGTVLIFAALVRIFNFFDLSFVHDELSALSRTKFDSLSELFSKGILIDGHPPLVQVFLYFWTSVFGYGTAIVKFPFLVLGIASIYYLFKVCKAFTQSNELSLIVSLFFAINQLHLSYSSIARMYITGFFFAMALVYHWKLWLDSSNKKDYIWMLVFASLCAYNHHFTLFFVVLVWVSGLFYISIEQKSSYLKAAAIVFAVYLPCSYITYYQLFVTQGLSWMSAPDSLFTEKFLSYFTHFNPIVFGVLLIGLVLSFIKKPMTSSLVILGFAWFIITYLVSYIYSVEIAPVLQYHLLLYVTPFLVIICFNGWLKFFQDKKLIYFGIAVNLLAFYSLVFSRNHFTLFPDQPYKTVSNAIKDLKKGKVLLVTDLNLSYLDFYLDDAYEYLDTLSETRLNTKDYQEILDTYDYIICASSSEFAEAFFTPAFEPIKQMRQYQGTEIDILQRSSPKKQEWKLKSSLDLKNSNADWSYFPQYLSNVDGRLSIKKPLNEPWGPTYETKFKSDINTLLCLEVDYIGDEIEGEMGLVFNFYDTSGEEVYSFIEHTKIESNKNGVSVAKAFLDLELVLESASKIKVFHWKKTETSMDILDMKLYSSEKTEVISMRNDTIISWQNFANKDQINWTSCPVSPITTGPFGELVAPLDRRGLWFPSFQTEIIGDGIYAFEFEFKPEKLSAFSKVVLSIKQDNKTVYYTSRNLNTFFKSDGKTWVKAVIGIPQGALENYSDKVLGLELMCFKPEGDIIQIKNPIVKKYKKNPFLYSSIGEINN